MAHLKSLNESRIAADRPKGQRFLSSGRDGILRHNSNSIAGPKPIEMITAIHRKKLLPLLVMLLALAGVSLSVIGEAASHGLVELADAPPDHDDHPHSHDDTDAPSKTHLHHDAGNHTHESVFHLTIQLITGLSSSAPQHTPFAAESPRRFRYRLERPPKVPLIV